MNGVKVDGLPALTQDLNGLGDDIVDLDLSALAQTMERLAKGYAPRRTGRLQGSIVSSSTPNRAHLEAGGPRAPYAGVIEFGWRAHNIEPALYMHRADMEAQQQAPGLIEDEVDALIKARGLE
jgi:hypothetical protein